ncbi:MAG TPA: M56 family metallopeptidase [Chitinophagaceae bacterium]|nr:M56 family metallopeptidase [Chitinophagaceae bacterium]
MPTNYYWLTDTLIPALCRTLMHSLWQGLAAALIAGVILLTTKRTTAAIRYNSLVALYVLLLAGVGTTFILELQSANSFAKSSTSSIDSFSIGPIPLNENSSLLSDNSNFLGSVLQFLDKNSLIIVSVWFFFFLFQLSKIVFGLRQIQKLRNQKIHLPENRWAEWISRKSRQLGINRTITLLQSEITKVPVAVGNLKPVILVPLGLLSQLSAEQVEAVLMHELAHIKRKDYFVNLLQSFADALFFFNPAFTWISSLIRQERETCCDDIVIQQTHNRNDYLEALISFENIRPSNAYAMALGTKKSFLLNRVKRILTRENSRLTGKEASSLVIGLVLIACSLMAFTPEKTVVQKKPQLIVDQHTPSVVLPPAKKDTVPQKRTYNKPIKFREIMTNIMDDGNNSTYQVQAIDENGTKYRFRKDAETITSITVNGKEIPKEDYQNYYPIIDAIEQERQARKAKAVQVQESKQRALEAEQAILAKKLAMLDEKRQSLLSDSMNLLKAIKQKEAEQATKATEPKNATSVHGASNPTLIAIIREMSARNLIQSETSISFTLTDSEFIINGKNQDQSLFEEFKTKYLKHPGDWFKYYREGGTTRTDIRTN